jgi:hypothetical protein
MPDAWRRDCALQGATPEAASAYDIRFPQILEVIWLPGCSGEHSVLPRVAGAGSGCARAGASSGTDTDGGDSAWTGFTCSNAAGRVAAGGGDVYHDLWLGKRTQILGSRKRGAVCRVGRSQHGRLFRDARESAERRAGVESGGSYLWTIFRGAGGEFCGRDGGSDCADLFLSPDGPSPAGATGLGGEYERVGRSGELGDDAPVGRCSVDAGWAPLWTRRGALLSPLQGLLTSRLAKPAVRAAGFILAPLRGLRFGLSRRFPSASKEKGRAPWARPLICGKTPSRGALP